jgi:hypothetical protein
LQAPKQKIYLAVTFVQVICILGCFGMTAQTSALLFRVDTIDLLLKHPAK